MLGERREARTPVAKTDPKSYRPSAAAASLMSKTTHHLPAVCGRAYNNSRAYRVPQKSFETAGGKEVYLSEFKCWPVPFFLSSAVAYKAPPAQYFIHRNPPIITVFDSQSTSAPSVPLGAPPEERSLVSSYAEVLAHERIASSPATPSVRARRGNFVKLMSLYPLSDGGDAERPTPEARKRRPISEIMPYNHSFVFQSPLTVIGVLFGRHFEIALVQRDKSLASTIKTTERITGRRTEAALSHAGITLELYYLRIDLHQTTSTPITWMVTRIRRSLSVPKHRKLTAVNQRDYELVEWLCCQPDLNLDLRNVNDASPFELALEKKDEKMMAQLLVDNMTFDLDIDDNGTAIYSLLEILAQSLDSTALLSATSLALEDVKFDSAVLLESPTFINVDWDEVLS
ncbi:hypothetical protein EVAR_32013_1 [Eumeta japonica]|uniref:Uncharacterized protein n=1 Tax=Eumeta variegata TaxID=151549 RepID=A0A4C1YI67_EUMVA|nr:hypothetical protein EVAR_32013_1 [Eumeta japonica]